MIIKSIEKLVHGQVLFDIEPGDTVQEACRRMRRHEVGSLAVMQDGRLVGIVSKRDLIRRCFAQGALPTATPICEIMTPDPVTIRYNHSVAEALTRMFHGGFRHLPVVGQNGRVCGMLSIRDIPIEYRLMVERQLSIVVEPRVA